MHGAASPCLSNSSFSSRLRLGRCAQVGAAEIEQVESVALDAALPAARQRRLGARRSEEVGAAVLDDDHLAVDDGQNLAIKLDLAEVKNGYAACRTTVPA